MDALRARLCGHAAPPAQSQRQHDGYNGRDKRYAMTAPLKHSDPITVDVALGDRAYDIVIGRDVLQSLGARVAALRPGVRTAIVTDRTVAKALAGADARRRWPRPASRRRMSSSRKARARRPMPDSRRSPRR